MTTKHVEYQWLAKYFVDELSRHGSSQIKTADARIEFVVRIIYCCSTKIIVDDASRNAKLTNNFFFHYLFIESIGIASINSLILESSSKATHIEIYTLLE